MKKSNRLRQPLVLMIGIWFIFYSTETRAQEHPNSETIRFVLAGDSTVTDEAGWGKGFAELCSENVECINLAAGGRSSRSYRTEGRWQKCLDEKPDFLLIQFGHNDQPGKGPERESAAADAFRDHLRAFVDESRAVGIVPVLITPLTRRTWTKDGSIASTLTEYAEATTIVSKEKNVPLVDLHSLSIRHCEQLGATAWRALEPMSETGADHTHLNSEGGRAVAALVVTALSEKVPETKQLFSQEKINATSIPLTYSRKVSQGTLQLEESESEVTIQQSEKLILSYRKQAPTVPDGIDPVYSRSGFLHPVASPAGHVVTAMYPFDHAHQDGVFTAWVKTTWHDREIDFWNLAGGTGQVLHQRIVRTFQEEDGVGFECDLIHQAVKDPVVDVLRERWRIKAFQTDGSHHRFDLETTQSALTDKPLLIQKYHYGGLALRGPVTWLTEKDSDVQKSGDQPNRAARRDPGEFLNDHGSDRIRGNHEHTRWVALTGRMDGHAVTITVLCHRDNFRAPQAARIHPTKPYFVFSPCVDDEFLIDREHPFRGKYRYLITDAAPDSQWLDEQWEQWCK